jgi:NADPH2:quinone reductase
LVHGAAGGVGLNAVEIGKILGATVIASAGSDAKLEIAKQYGADHVINYATDSIRDRVKQITAGRGADLVFDPIGGDVFDQSLRAVTWGGRILVVGFAAGRIPAAPANLVLLKSLDLLGVHWGGFAERFPERNRANFAAMFRWYEQGRLKPRVSLTVPLARAAEGMNALLRRTATGKVVVDIGRA